MLQIQAEFIRAVGCYTDVSVEWKQKKKRQFLQSHFQFTFSLWEGQLLRQGTDGVPNCQLIVFFLFQSSLPELHAQFRAVCYRTSLHPSSELAHTPLILQFSSSHNLTVRDSLRQGQWGWSHLLYLLFWQLPLAEKIAIRLDVRSNRGWRDRPHPFINQGTIYKKPV